MSSSTFRHLLAAVLVGVLAPFSPAAPPVATAPATQSTPSPAPTAGISPGSRILKTFDFEETSLGNYETTPMFWAKVSGRGYPAFATGRFDTSLFRRHDPPPAGPATHTSFRLDIDSGSVAYRYNAPPQFRIPVNSNADYYILGFCKTSPLKYARAEIAAWYADENGNLLPSTEAHSDRYAARSEVESADAGAWHILHLYMPGPKPAALTEDESSHAKYLVLQVGLLQPQQLSTETTPQDAAKDPTSNLLGRFALYHQDIKGSAWFDDITIFQLPRVSVEVPSSITSNVFAPDQPINLDLTVSDLAQNAADHESALNVALRITDPNGLIFASEQWPVHTTPDQAWTHHYSHAPLPPNAYTATLDITDTSTGTLIARRQTHFLALGNLPAGLDANGKEKLSPEFGFTATTWPTSAWKELPIVLRESGVGLLQIPAWRHDMSEDALQRRDPAFDSLLNSLQRLDAHALGTFSELPAVLAEKLHDAPAAATSPSASAISSQDDQITTLADTDPALWRPFASFLIARYSNLIDNWEIGSPATPFSGSLIQASAVAASGHYPQLYAAANRELASLLNRPRLVIPWNALFDFDARNYPNALLDLRIPTAIKPTQVPTYIHNFQESSAVPNTPGANDIFVHLDTLDPELYTHGDRDADFAQRVIYARSANPTAIFADLPLQRCSTISSGSTHTEPDELLLVYRTLARTLGGAVFRREIPVAPGIRAFLFIRSNGIASADPENPSEGILTVWNESASDANFITELPLGPSPRAVELTGLSRALQPDPNSLLTRINITNTPLIITHVDAPLIQLRASFALGSSNIPAGAGVMRTDVHLSNPYPDPLSATLHMAGPTGWSIDPSNIPVAIPPGGEFRHPVTIRYPYTEVAGPKSVNATLSADNDGPGGGGHPLQLSYPVSVRSETVDIDGFARFLPNGDLLVQAMVTNLSSNPLNAETYALVPGFARQQHFVLNLPPGQTIIKRFLFPLEMNVNYSPKSTPAQNAELFANKAVTLGLRQSDGRTLLTKAFPLN